MAGHIRVTLKEQANDMRGVPLDMKSEVHQRCDQMAVSYRRWLKEQGFRYGTSLGAAASAEEAVAA